jgi:L-alanine-DL-glutamate epimerase-like enolase superfamily enzyme
MQVVRFRFTRFQYRRDRVIGDSQVRITQSNVAALELITDTGATGLGFMLSLFHPLPDLVEIERMFEAEAWPGVSGQAPIAVVHRLHRPRGGNIRALSLPFGEAINQAMWDLAAQQAGLPLWQLLGGTDPKVRAYASGLDFHLSDAEFSRFFTQAAVLGFRGFKIKVGHPDVEWDVNRLRLLQEAVGTEAAVMVDANEAWTPKETIRRLDIFRRAGFEILWVEDPCLRDDFRGLREIREAVPSVHVNSGEYLDLHGKRLLMEGRGADILNVHGNFSDVMRAGWLAGEHGIEISLGNTMLELGVHLASALPEARWLEYSFQNYFHILD